eukprot:TRINITY_DN8518_c0_g1_i1.p1 TRINITY_DN8518_c0_g1~~TRINITY_DN8518_c0_g1_i1.p1  ORF type:complete len:363 (-),score=60.45 TRINITY_DN8518_c0_g1_i1:3-1091(-)
MHKYTHPFVPGPTMVPSEISSVYTIDFASSDIEDEFFSLYDTTRSKLKRLLNCSGDISIQSGEAMVVLWGAMKSVLNKGDKVLAIGTGVYGDGIGEMAEMIGAEVKYVKFEWDESATDMARIRSAVEEFRPKLITAVHSETPCGTINPCDQIGAISKEFGALFYVDFVSSGGGMKIDVDAWNIDLGLLGTQKCLSMPPDLGIVTVSDRAQKAIDQVNYVGYDAIKPWNEACEKKFFPYTHNWRAIAALSKSLDLLEKEGLDKVYERHEQCKKLCLDRIRQMGLKPYPKSDEYSSPTVTAVYVPEGWSWSQLDTELRQRGVCFGGTYGKIADKVFRIGHMGVQANTTRLNQALDVLESILKKK